MYRMLKVQKYFVIQKINKKQRPGNGMGDPKFFRIENLSKENAI